MLYMLGFLTVVVVLVLWQVTALCYEAQRLRHEASVANTNLHYVRELLERVLLQPEKTNPLFMVASGPSGVYGKYGKRDSAVVTIEKKTELQPDGTWK
jgi:hypothetical protein